MFLFNLQNTGN